jgi:hypothetical protein
MEPDPIQMPFEDVPYHLRGYQARLMREVSNAKRHVYFSAPLKMYITVRSVGGKAELDFTHDCPCSQDED